MGFTSRGTHITRNMCFLGMGSHITNLVIRVPLILMRQDKMIYYETGVRKIDPGNLRLQSLILSIRIYNEKGKNPVRMFLSVTTRF